MASSGTASVDRTERTRFNLDTGALVLSFGEPVQVRSINFTALVLQSSGTSAAQSLRLSPGNLVVDQNISLTVSLVLTAEDVVAWKPDALITIG